MKTFKNVVLIFLIFIYGCDKNESESEIVKSEIYFNTVPVEKSGLNFINALENSPELNIIEYLYYYNGGGVAIGDINNDNLEDIYFTANQTSDRLFLNQGNLKFKDITEEAGIKTDSSWSSGVTMVDINNDGLLDIYVAKVGNYKNLKSNNQLYINKGNNNFEESAASYGLNFSGFSTQSSFFDYDNDGDLDMYLMNHSVHTPRSYGNSVLRFEKDSLAGDLLFENQLNEGNQKFVDVTEAAGIYSSALGYGLALTTSDVNNDGLIDIYVGNDFHENDYLYINQGDKTFLESNAEYFSHSPRFTMGVDIADINNDLLFDIFALDMMPYDKEIFLKSGGEDSDKVSQIKANFGFEKQYARNTLQLNQGNQYFSDIALMTNTFATDWSWSTLIQDFDNDGKNDIYVTNGIYKRPNDLNYINYLSNINFAKYDQSKQDEIEELLIKEMPTVNLSNVLFHNKGDYKFDRLSEESGFSPSYSNGAAYSDLDNDGDIDIVVNNINQSAHLLENTSSNDSNFISFDLKGNGAFPNAIGSKVYVYAESLTYVKEYNIVRGFQSSSTHKIHFGLGNIKAIDSVNIHWPDGSVQVEKDVLINQNHTLTKLNAEEVETTVQTTNENTIEYVTFPFVNIENIYNDYDSESLIPEKLSTEGPAFASADFNGDDLIDIFIGGAKYQSSSLYIKNLDGSYTKDSKSEFIKDIAYEDVDVATFDFDNDGDLDLYIMSGGNDKIENDGHLEDRIYINDGNAYFTRLKQVLLRANGGSISSADFNKDGYSDFFIGSRSIPGGYGLSPFSFILKSNGSGSFDIVKKERYGMITDSRWVDLNSDGLLDLIVVGDWMPITILMNNGDDTFTNKTREFGLENSYGMWNTIEFGDFDGNGQIDIVAGNIGLNSKWKASKDKPIQLYLDDFDGNTQSDPIIFYDFFGNSVPFASKDKLVEQLPKLKKKFLDYEKFAKIESVEDLVDVKVEDILEQKKITELRSMLYLNIGVNTKSIPLPKEAQTSTIEDILIDENLVYFVGNFSGFTTELGHSMANSGGVFTIDESGNFSNYESLPIPPRLEGRKIEKIGENEFLVITNGRSYKFKM